MEKVYTKEDYAKAYMELVEILKNVPREKLNKIPKELIYNYIKDMDKNHKYQYDVNLEFEEQETMHLTKILIANLYIQYWADDNERQQIKERERKELYELELSKKEKYNPVNLFEKKDNQDIKQSQELIIIEKKTILQKIIDKIKRLIKIKQN